MDDTNKPNMQHDERTRKKHLETIESKIKVTEEKLNALQTKLKDLWELSQETNIQAGKIIVKNKLFGGINTWKTFKNARSLAYENQILSNMLGNVIKDALTDAMQNGVKKSVGSINEQDNAVKRMDNEASDQKPWKRDGDCKIRSSLKR